MSRRAGTQSNGTRREADPHPHPLPQTMWARAQKAQDDKERATPEALAEVRENFVEGELAGQRVAQPIE